MGKIISEKKTPTDTECYTKWFWATGQPQTNNIFSIAANLRHKLNGLLLVF